MIDWLAIWGVTQATAFIFKPILEDLAKDAAKDWAKDLLKGIPKKIVDKLKKEDIEIAAGKALKEFLQLMQQQLKVRCKLPEEEIKDYTKDIKKFISDKSVKEILGKAFDISCEDLNFKTLEDSWKRLQLQPLPSKFNWQAFTDQYFTQVQELLLESKELHSILELQKLSSIDNTLKENADIPKDFNLVQYLETIRERYGNLKLDSLENTSREHPVNLWQIFIPQNVRQVYQVLPELPKEYLRRLQESNQLDAEFEIEKFKEELEGYKRNYLEQPIRSVLDVIRQDKPRKNYLVILGDPGSGKSTLLQYLALDWVEQTLTKNDFNLPIPLLIELRNYVRDRDAGTCNNFLEYYHKGPNCFFHLNQHKLHEQLKAGNALVMFDGLDEIFELAKREEVITSIHRFTNEYPDVQVIVTSRIIGYKQQQLRDAEFRHFMLQDLEPAQIKDFIERWHDKTFSQAEERDKNIKRERLQRVINESKAIAELAQNPLLLTMMAILNLKRELPRDRSELYKDASEVLLHNWDEGRNLKPDERLETIDYKDKQAMLRQVAYQMQTSEKGLAGNIIHGDDLEAIFTKYLESIPVSDARDKARRLMKQLRDRNFILCFLGANHYAFVHRTFLEFFCASEFVRQFEKERSITIEDLKTEVFGRHWRDETWHEVLRLIAGMIEPKFVGEIIEYLIVQDSKGKKFVNLFLAAQCLEEVRNRTPIASTASKLLVKLKDLLNKDYQRKEVIDKADYLDDDVEDYLDDDAEDYLDDDVKKTIIFYDVMSKAISSIATTWRDEPDTLSWLKTCAKEGYNTQQAALRELAKDWTHDLEALKICAEKMHDPDSRKSFLQKVVKGFQDSEETLSWLKNRAQSDISWLVRQAAMDEVIKCWKYDPATLPFVKAQAKFDDWINVRQAALQQLSKEWKDDPGIFEFLHDCAIHDPFERIALSASNPRQTALEAIIKEYPQHPQTLPLLRDRAENDPDEKLRKFAQKKLKEWKV
ncbi:hypothetical protein BV372_14020 [Nostoc sp. T09]|uniref:NACHT domain-containing protein n=1 Tax=Nostoc sp. T09 TaxID=1932621 RepID=UPI000A3880E5|nr:NACHT domain-containing protein [Nostoc sp. T09]OUL34396.1 hypothetical protein BV372_14020 [Nostoc sp. T09]